MKLTNHAKRLWIGLAATLPLWGAPASAQVDPNTAYFLERVAALGLAEQVLSENPFVAGWEDATLSRDDVWLYYDPIGQPSFYEIGVFLNGERAGRIKVGAHPLLGSTVLSVESTPRPWSVSDAAWVSVALVAFGHPDATLLDAILVAYDGLKTGIVVLYDDPGAGGFGFEVWDLSTLTLVPDANLRSNLASIPAGETQQRYDQFVQDLEYALVLDGLLATENLSLDKVFEAEFDEDDWNTLQQVDGAFVTDEPHVTVDINRCKLYLQEKGDWCVRAFHQMISHYYHGGPLHSQTQIDSLLASFGWNQNWILAMQTYFTLYNFKTATAFHPIAPSTPTAVTWPNLTGEIDAGRPFGLYTSDLSTTHIAMEVGYQETRKDVPPGAGLIGGDTFFREYWVHVYDPGVGMFSAKAWRGDVMTYPGTLAGYFVVK